LGGPFDTQWLDKSVPSLGRNFKKNCRLSGKIVWTEDFRKSRVQEGRVGKGVVSSTYKLLLATTLMRQALRLEREHNIVLLCCHLFLGRRTVKPFSPISFTPPNNPNTRRCLVDLRPAIESLLRRSFWRHWLPQDTAYC
jgi:hypothetical protein